MFPGIGISAFSVSAFSWYEFKSYSAGGEESPGKLPGADGE